MCNLTSPARVARALSLPKSSVYRWAAQQRAKNSSPSAGATESIAELYGICKQLGFAAQGAINAVLSDPRLDLSSGFKTRPNPDDTGRALRKSVDVHGSPANGDVPPEIRAAFKYLIENYSHPLRMHELASMVGLSRIALIKKFTFYFKVSPYQFLLRTRVDKAEHLLAGSKIPTAQVSRMVGFGSVSALQRAYIKFRSKTPGRVVIRSA